MDYKKNIDIPVANRVDYSYNKDDVKYFKDQMIRETEKFKVERVENEELVPLPDKKEIDLEIVKDQILDLNDKFDYLIFVMMKNKKMAATSGNNFTLGEASSSLNAHHEHDEQDLKEDVKTFESAAKKEVGSDRLKLRKPAPK